MFLKQLNLVQFKNYAEASVQLHEGVNCFVGHNGAGKTNVLDAVYYTSMCRSYLNPIDSQNISFDEHFFILQALWEKADQEFEVYCGVKRGQKKMFKKNKVDYEKLADHIGQFPTVMISPYDADLIASGSEMRRKWLDGLISQFDRNYLDALMKYNAILAQRNALLKNASKGGLFEPEAFDVWDEQMAQVGKIIYDKRLLFLEKFTPVFQSYFTDISRSDEIVGFTYLSQLQDSDFDDLLKKSRSKDCVMGYSTAGIHKDDLIFELHGHPIKKVGSQGQQKSFLIALKLAQFHELTNALGVKPVLLLDDIFDKLDNERVTRLMRLVSEQLFGQVLVTDTDAERVRSIFDAINVPIRLFHVESGKIMQHEHQEIAR